MKYKTLLRAAQKAFRSHRDVTIFIDFNTSNFNRIKKWCSIYHSKLQFIDTCEFVNFVSNTVALEKICRNDCSYREMLNNYFGPKMATSFLDNLF